MSGRGESSPVALRCHVAVAPGVVGRRRIEISEIYAKRAVPDAVAFPESIGERPCTYTVQNRDVRHACYLVGDARDQIIEGVAVDIAVYLESCIVASEHDSRHCSAEIGHQLRELFAAGITGERLGGCPYRL